MARLTEIVGFIGEEVPAATEVVDAAKVDVEVVESIEEPPRVDEELLF